MLSNVFFVFDIIYKLFKLQFCIVVSLVVGLFFFSFGPMLYATSAIIDEIVKKESSSVVRAYFTYFKEGFKKTSLVGLFTIVFVVCSILFAYNLRLWFGTSVIGILSNIYYLFVLLAVLIVYTYTSIIRDYKLTWLEAIKTSLRVIYTVPFVPLFIVLWSIATSVIFSTIIGLYVMLGLSFYLGGVFLIINLFLKENEEAVNYEIN